MKGRGISLKIFMKTIEFSKLMRMSEGKMVRRDVLVILGESSWFHGNNFNILNLFVFPINYTINFIYLLKFIFGMSIWC